MKFENNQPREIALAFAQGRITPSNFGADQVMYTLEYPPNHITFVDLGASQKINQLRAAQGERLMICKRKGAERNSPVRWDVALASSAEMARAAEEAGVPLKADGRPAWGGNPPGSRAPAAADPESALERDLRASLAKIEREKAEAAVRAAAPVPAAIAQPATASQADSVNNTAPVTRLEAALKTAVAAAFAATEYAKKIGYAAMPMFTSEDIRTMANTLIIDAGKQGGRQ